MEATVIDAELKALASGPNFAALSTLDADGWPQTTIVWVDCDDEHLLVNTEVARRKARNAERDPRVAVTIWDHESPYQAAFVQGRVVDRVTGDRARAHIDELSMRYTGHPYDPSAIKSERVILVIEPGKA
jgi:PPOX class probable F420-dependent enzyme